jgi:hypothetical protein
MNSPTREKDCPKRPAAAAPELTLVWEQLVPHVLHPVKVAVIEALRWVGQPLSSTDLAALFDDKGDYYLSLISYHVKQLAGYGVLVSVRRQQKRGAIETFYYFSAQPPKSISSKHGDKHRAAPSRALPSVGGADETNVRQP